MSLFKLLLCCVLRQRLHDSWGWPPSGVATESSGWEWGSGKFSWNIRKLPCTLLPRRGGEPRRACWWPVSFLKLNRLLLWHWPTHRRASSPLTGSATHAPWWVPRAPAQRSPVQPHFWLASAAHKRGSARLWGPRTPQGSRVPALAGWRPEAVPAMIELFLGAKDRMVSWWPRVHPSAAVPLGARPGVRHGGLRSRDAQQKDRKLSFPARRVGAPMDTLRSFCSSFLLGGGEKQGDHVELPSTWELEEKGQEAQPDLWVAWDHPWASSWLQGPFSADVFTTSKIWNVPRSAPGLPPPSPLPLMSHQPSEKSDLQTLLFLFPDSLSLSFFLPFNPNTTKFLYS